MSRGPEDIPAAVLTVVARRVLLDALEALRAHRDAITLIGAQAVHLRTVTGQLTTASYTSDADLGVDPQVLENEPLLEQIMTGAGFTAGANPGHWRRPEKIGDRVEDVVVDLMVAESFSGPGSRRSGMIPPHARLATRRTAGLEPAAVDYDILAVPSLEPDHDHRILDVRVAGVAALLVSKSYKLWERFREPDQRRLVAKDAGDVLRLMLATDVAPVIQRIGLLLADPRSEAATRQGLEYLDGLFGAPRRPGVVMAIDALSAEVDAEQIRSLAPAYTAALKARNS